MLCRYRIPYGAHLWHDCDKYAIVAMKTHRHTEHMPVVLMNLIHFTTYLFYTLVIINYIEYDDNSVFYQSGPNVYGSISP